MRVAHYLIREPSGLFYFRLRVPMDLRPLVGRAIIKRATGVRCPRQALAIATDWAARYARAFDALRGHGMADEKLVEALLKGIRKRGTMEYRLNMATGEVEANGPEDHARALEAIREIGAITPEFRARVAAARGAVPMDMDEGIRMWALTLP